MAAVYPQILERPVQTAFVEVETPATVRVPSTDCLLGDKLAAFAPRSIGVLYQPVSRRTGEPQEPRPIRIMKQLFDVGELFNEANDLAMVAKTHAQIFEEQNTYRGGNFTQAGVLDDTLEAAFTLSQIDLKPIVENEVTALFRTGVRSLNNHLFSEDYTFTRAKVAAARAALVTAALKSPPANGAFMNLRSALPEPAKLKDLAVAEPWNKLTALKKTSPEAFYRWYQARAMLG